MMADPQSPPILGLSSRTLPSTDSISTNILPVTPGRNGGFWAKLYLPFRLYPACTCTRSDLPSPQCLKENSCPSRSCPRNGLSIRPVRGRIFEKEAGSDDGSDRGENGGGQWS